MRNGTDYVKGSTECSRADAGGATHRCAATSDTREVGVMSERTKSVATVKLLYFAWVRERIGRPEETHQIPASITTVADLITWLKGRGPEYQAAFAEPDVIRAAVDQQHVEPDAPIAGSREIAFFPPVTGG